VTLIIARSAGGFIAAGSNQGDVVELDPSSPEVSDAENEAGMSAGIISLNVGGNDWRVKRSKHSRSSRSMAVVDLCFHKQLIPTMVEFTSANISDYGPEVHEEEMRRFVGIMFAMMICPMSNIKDYWITEYDGLMVASRFYEILHMSCVRVAMIRKNWATAPAQRIEDF
jgi:hypothetical protein